MIDLHYWPTRNGHKLTIFLEESGIDYRIIPVNIQRWEQFRSEFLTLSPNNKTPAIVDHDPIDGGSPISVFESGAILLYLAQKSGQFYPGDLRERTEVLQWLFWQVAGIGPMGGQTMLFKLAEEQIPSAITRFTNEMKRLVRVLDTRLADRPFLAGDTYSIADIATYPWVAPYDFFELDLNETPNVERWLTSIALRPAVARAYEIGASINPGMHRPPAHAKALGTDRE